MSDDDEIEDNYDEDGFDVPVTDETFQGTKDRRSVAHHNKSVSKSAMDQTNNTMKMSYKQSAPSNLTNKSLSKHELDRKETPATE